MADLFAPGAKITFRDKEACARRELEFRRRVYQRRVADGKMKQSDADREIELMEAIRESKAKKRCSVLYCCIGSNIQVPIR